MERNISLDEITDGKRYGRNDMVKASCNDCKGCSACCEGMGNSIVVDPYDIYRLTTGLGKTMEELLSYSLELNVVGGMILPNLKMQGERECCAFLNEEGRCSIHKYRPGICRIFPLGRVYEDGKFDYILQVHECKKENRTKVKVSKWIDTPDQKENETFIIEWHYFIKELQKRIQEGLDEAVVKQLNMYVLHLFYLTPYEKDVSFYEQFGARLLKAKELLA